MRLSLFCLATLVFSSIAAAAEPPPPPPQPGDEEPYRHSHFSAAIGPAWVHILRDNYTSAETATGFSAPGRDRIGLDLLAYWNTETHWQLGFAMTNESFEQELGTSAADYSNGLFGLYVARNFGGNPDTDVTIGATLGMNSADLTVFSSTLNGRVRESSAVVAPSIGYASRVSRAVKLGVRASYIMPFGESIQTSGNSLGVSRIGIRGFSLALNVIFGR